MLFASGRQAHERRIRELEHELERIRGELSKSLLDTDEIRDQARRMLNRANAQRRWVEKMNGDDGTPKTNIDEINQQILDGRYPG